MAKTKKPQVYEALRNTIVVVAVLILSVTYQAAINPPGGTWPTDDSGHLAGTPVLRDKERINLALYCFFNKLAFFFAMVIVILCMYLKVVKAVRICKVLVIAAVLSMVATFITGTLLIASENKKLHPFLEEIIIHVVALTIVAAIVLITAYRPGFGKIVKK